MTASFADNEIWHVLIAADDMKRMNVEQLDDAFRLSLVDASTLVWKVGMKTWQRLGAVAGIDDDRAPPPPPAPRAAPRTPTQIHYAQAQAAQAAAQAAARAAAAQAAAQHAAAQAAQQALEQQRAQQQAYQQAYQQHITQQRAHQQQAEYHARQAQAYQAQFAQASRQTAFAQTLPAANRAFAGTQRMAPVAAPSVDPFVMPKRRAALVSDVDFRSNPRGVRWGRWLVGILVLTCGVLVAYRQNLLRGGARSLGLERSYLAAEWRTTAWLTARAPYGARAALTQLKLLPGPNALPPTPVVQSKPPVAPAPPPAAVTPPPAPSAPSDVKTVSLDALPVLTPGTEPAKAAAPAEAAPVVTKPKAVTAPAPVEQAERRVVKERPAPAVKAARSESVARVEKPKPERAKPEPKAKAEPPPPANESFLNSAIRSAIAADKAGKKK